MKKHFFGPNDTIFIIRSLAIFKLACDTRYTRGQAAIWVSHILEHDLYANALNDYLYTDESFAPFAFLVRSQQRQSQKFCQSYTGAVNCLLNKFITDQAIAGYSASILGYMQPWSMALQQYPDDVNVT